MRRTASRTRQSLLPRFGAGFLDDHARLIISDPKIAIIELVANSWDSGATLVEITWPNPAPERISIKDNGSGMTYDEFTQRWCELNYNRREAQGTEVSFPSDIVRTSRRTAFGRNGKGRHSMFCFNDQYFVKTWRDGQLNEFKVERSAGDSPFKIDLVNFIEMDGHGTEIYTELHRHDLDLHAVRELIGSKFIADPAFRITVNGEAVEFTELEHLFGKREVEIPGIGTITIRIIDSHKRGRTSKQHGIAWWVNKRLVGEPSWKGFDDEAFLDARSSEAKRYTFIVEADMLADNVMADWSGFWPDDKVALVQEKAKTHILEMLRELMGDVHKSRKITALVENLKGLRELSPESLNYIGKVVDEVQGKYPSFGERELQATVTVITNLEKSRSGFSLLEQLSKLNAEDLEQLSEILSKWTVQEARIVLNELEKRIKLIENLERLVEEPTTDELHELQPLFERGLWIFGPEYESIEYTSNKTLVTVLVNLLKEKITTPLTNPRRRPDFVVLPNSTLGIYSRDSFDERGEPNGLAKILIVELKRGAFEITHDEVTQAEDYIRELRKGQRVQKQSEIVAFVLGAKVAEDAEEKRLGQPQHSVIYPRTYSTVLRMAHARTFNLLRAIQSVKKDSISDPEIAIVLNVPVQSDMQGI